MSLRDSSPNSNSSCWKYTNFCQTDVCQWFMKHTLFDHYLLVLIMDYCGDSALSIKEWLDLMHENPDTDMIDFSGFTPEMIEGNSTDYTSFLSVGKNKSPVYISFYKDDFTDLYTNYGGLFYIQLTEIATERFVRLIQKLVDQITVKTHAPLWIDYGVLSYFTQDSLKLGFYDLYDLKVFVRQMTPNLITYYKNPHFKRQVRQVLLDQNIDDLTENHIHFVNQIYRACIRIHDIYIKDSYTVCINMELVTLELYHDKIPQLLTQS